MNELYEFMKQVDVMAVFILVYAMAVSGIAWFIKELISLIVDGANHISKKRREKKERRNAEKAKAEADCTETTIE